MIFAPVYPMGVYDIEDDPAGSVPSNGTKTKPYGTAACFSLFARTGILVGFLFWARVEDGRD
jgi:hypothetical protein